MQSTPVSCSYVSCRRNASSRGGHDSVRIDSRSSAGRRPADEPRGAPRRALSLAACGCRCGLAFLPFAPDIRIAPDLALALFVAPALLDAAFDTSPRELRRNAWPIASLAVIVVVLTTAAVAFIGWRYAALPIGAAIALGAIVAPPDAAAAGAVLRRTAASAADRIRPAGRKPAQRRDRAADLPCRRDRHSGRVLAAERRPADRAIGLRGASLPATCLPGSI